MKNDQLAAHFHSSSIPPHFAPRKNNRISSYITNIVYPKNFIDSSPYRSWNLRCNIGE